MSLTSSSAEQGQPKRSAVETLASRYRHLFVLPSAQALLLYTGIVSLFLSLASRGANGIIVFLPALVVSVLSVSAVSSALFIADKKTIATFRRTDAVIVGSGILWLFCMACGIVYTRVVGSPFTISNMAVFGAFACAGLEFLVINGAFTENVPLALGLSAIYPASNLAILRYAELSKHFDPLPVIFGAGAFVTFAAFTFVLKRKKTSLGYSALTLFQAFMKTWTSKKSGDLEKIISDHSEEGKVTTKVLRFQTEGGDIFIAIPGVHPGPFHPIGSYDLPGVISRAFKLLGPVMTLHRPGGHEGNLATVAETEGYADDVSDFARGIKAPESADVRGPDRNKIGKANVSSTAFSKDLLVTISFAPLGSDDLGPEVEEDLSGPASSAGFDLSVVDAHNSIDDEQELPDLKEPGWKRMIEEIKRPKPHAIQVAYSHSSEFSFGTNEDLTENGIGLLMLEADGQKSVLILADANNSVPTLRGKVDSSLRQAGYSLIEFCTSDSHNLAARGLTVSRGYKALGEATSVESIANLAVEMARKAETRLAPARYGSGQLTSDVKVFGAKALEEFAAITQSSSRVGRAYFRFATVSVSVLLLLSLLL